MCHLSDDIKINCVQTNFAGCQMPLIPHSSRTGWTKAFFHFKPMGYSEQWYHIGCTFWDGLLVYQVHAYFPKVPRHIGMWWKIGFFEIFPIWLIHLCPCDIMFFGPSIHDIPRIPIALGIFHWQVVGYLDQDRPELINVSTGAISQYHYQHAY